MVCFSEMCILKKHGLFIGYIHSDEGLIANATPQEHLLEVRRQLDPVMEMLGARSVKTEIHIKVDHLQLADLIYGLHTDPIAYWEESKSIPINFKFYTEKQKVILMVLRDTFPGETLSYGDLAARAGMPRAARFVGSTMAHNLTPLFIPCHRVIKANGQLGRYSAGGSDLKYRYLELESRN